MKKLCDKNIERYVRNKYYDELARLTPVKRFVRKFELLLDSLSLEVREGDDIFGWFVFCGEEYESRAFPEEELSREIEGRAEELSMFGTTSVQKGHTLINYERILNFGLSDYEERVKKALDISPDSEYLKAMADTLGLVKKFVQRIIRTVDEKLKNCTSDGDLTRLERIKGSLSRVPFSPAGDFRDAVQSVWLIHFLAPLCEDSWASISLGRLDQYLYPYYRRSIDEGVTRDEAKNILHNLYRLLNSYADGACLVNVGSDYNELSELLIECQRDFALPGPILAPRIGENTPWHIWEMLIDPELFSRGQPTFYGERSCINALLERGISLDVAKAFSNNSCMGIGIVGEEYNSMWGCVFQISAVLETALNRGRLITAQSNEVVPDIGEVNSLDELYAEFEKCAEYLFDKHMEIYDARAEYTESTKPDCFVSLLTEGCIERGIDMISGANYHNVTVECMGMINAADGIAAIDRLVFKEKKYVLGEIIEAVKNDFRGYEKMHREILDSPKFGQNSEADMYSVKTSEILQKVIRSHDKGNRFHLPSLHTLDKNVTKGELWGAGFDGRRRGEPFAKNSGASNFVRRADPTSLVLSAIKLPQQKFFGGQPIDVSFDLDTVKNHKKEIAALISAYLLSGGLQFQVNALSSVLLREAQKSPEKYPHLVVRIGGYSLYFNDLSDSVKTEFIERFEREGN